MARCQRSSWSFTVVGVGALTLGCGNSPSSRRPPDNGLAAHAAVAEADKQTSLDDVLRQVVMPKPESITVDEPGGDAPDAHAASLAQMLKGPLGWAGDKDDQVRIMLPDWSHWKRVRYFGFEHLVGFRYGSDHHAISVVLVADTRQGRAPTSETCMRHAETLARPRAREYALETQPIVESRVNWRGKSLVVHSTDGEFPYGFRRISFAAAWIAYPAYESSCLYQVFAAKYEGHPELARKLRDRWIAEAAPQVDIRTTTKPYRHE